MKLQWEWKKESSLLKSQNKKAWLNGHAGEEFADNCVDRLILKP